MTARSQPMTGEVPGQLPIADGRAVVAEVLRSLAGLWAQVAGAALLLTIAAGTGLVMPVGLGRIVDQLDAGTTTSRVLAIGAIILAGIAVSAVVGAWGTTLSTRLFDRVVARLRERVVERALLLPQATIERAGSGDLVARAGSDVATIGDGLSSVLPTLTATVFGFVVTIAGLAVLDWRLLVVLLAIYLPLTVTALRYFLRAAPPVWAEANALVSTRSNRVISTYRGIETVTAFGLAERQVDGIVETTWPVVHYGMLTRLIYSRMLTRLSVAEVLSLAALLGVAFWLVREGHSTLGAATASVLLLYRLFEPTMQALSIANQLQAAVASLARVVGVIDAGAHDDGSGRPARRSAGTAMTSPVADGHLDGRRGARDRGDVGTRAGRGQYQRAAVDVHGVTYAYTAGRPVLHDVDLTIAPGEHVAAVGTSGAGKTTLAALIAGTLAPDAGTITIGGHDVAAMDRAERAATVAMISQTTHVFDGPLRDDLTLARPDATDDELFAALDLVGAAWARALPDGLCTLVGRTARSLTAAQEQQLALARLVLKDPAVAVLDEATAEAGSSGARLLERAAAAATEGRTAIVVAHRLSQATIADRVVVMEGGRIVEDGTHAELAASNGIYGRLWSAWTAGRE